MVAGAGAVGDEAMETGSGMWTEIRTVVEGREKGNGEWGRGDFVGGSGQRSCVGRSDGPLGLFLLIFLGVPGGFAGGLRCACASRSRSRSGTGGGPAIRGPWLGPVGARRRGPESRRSFVETLTSRSPAWPGRRGSKARAARAARAARRPFRAASGGTRQEAVLLLLRLDAARAGSGGGRVAVCLIVCCVPGPAALTIMI